MSNITNNYYMKIFLTGAVLMSARVHSMEPVEQSVYEQPDSGFALKKEKSEDQKARPIGILINHRGKDNSAIGHHLEHFLNAEFHKENHFKPILMVSPDLILNLLNKLDEEYNDRPTHNYEGKKRSQTRNRNEDGSYDCKNHFELILKEVIFIDVPNSHFIIMFPGVYKQYLAEHKTCVFRTTEELKELAQTRTQHPDKKDFQTFTTICNSISGIYFKAFVTGHGWTSSSLNNTYIPNEELTLICDLFPKECSEMLQAFNNSNIITTTLDSCCIGGANRYFLKNKLSASGAHQWTATSYSFNLLIRGIADIGLTGFNYANYFLTAIVTLEMSPEKIVLALTPSGNFAAATMLQILPAHEDTFKCYDNENCSVIDESTTLPDHAIKKSNILINQKQISKTLTLFIDGHTKNFYFIAPETNEYTLEKISLTSTNKNVDTGVVSFVKKAFSRAGTKRFPRTILIKELEGKNDIKPGSHQELETISLQNINISANNCDEYGYGESVSFSFTHNDEKYVIQ